MQEGRPHRLIQTPVKTSFVSVIFMMLWDKKVVSKCFGSKSDINIRKQVPTQQTWVVVQFIVETFGTTDSSQLKQSDDFIGL